MIADYEKDHHTRIHRIKSYYCSKMSLLQTNPNVIECW